MSNIEIIRSLKMKAHFLNGLNRYEKLIKAKLHTSKIISEDIKYIQGYVQVHSFMRQLEFTNKLNDKIKEIKNEMDDLKLKYPHKWMRN